MLDTNYKQFETFAQDMKSKRVQIQNKKKMEADLRQSDNELSETNKFELKPRSQRVLEKTTPRSSRHLLKKPK